jgi:hypothetical protein
MRLNSGSEKSHKHIPVLAAVKVPLIVLQVVVVVLLSSVLMNGAEVYASRVMLLLLAPASTSALSRYSSWLTMRFTTNSLVGEMILLT